MADRYRAHVRREANQRTAIAMVLLAAVGVTAVALQVTGAAPLLPVLAVELLAGASIIAWQARTLRTPALVQRWLNRKYREVSRG